MVLAVRFRFYGAKTPTFDIVELNHDQWRGFFWLERSMMHFLFRFIPLKATKWLNDNIRHQHEVMAAKAKEC